MSVAKVIAFAKNTLSAFQRKLVWKKNVCLNLWKRCMFLDHAPCCLVDYMIEQHRLLLDLWRALLPHRFCPLMSMAINQCPAAQHHRIRSSVPSNGDSGLGWVWRVRSHLLFHVRNVMGVEMRCSPSVTLQADLWWSKKRPLALTSANNIWERGQAWMKKNSGLIFNSL
jgi:hypothetical protein